MRNLLIFVAVCVLFLATAADALAYVRFLHAAPAPFNSAPSYNFFLDDVQYGTTLDFGNTASSGGAFFGNYLSTSAGSHVFVVKDFVQTQVYNSSFTVQDGKYYTLALTADRNPGNGSLQVVTLQDDAGTGIPAGSSKVRFVNLILGSYGNTSQLFVNGTAVGTPVAFGNVLGGDYINVTSGVNTNVTITIPSAAASYWFWGNPGVNVNGPGFFNSTTNAAVNQTLYDGARVTVNPGPTVPPTTASQTTTAAQTTTAQQTTTQQPATTQPQTTQSSASTAVLSVALLSAIVVALMF